MVEDIRQHQYHRHRDQRLSQPGRNLLILKAWQPQQANDQPKDQDKVANSSNPLMQPMVRARTRGAQTAQATKFSTSAHQMLHEKMKSQTDTVAIPEMKGMEPDKLWLVFRS